MPSTASINTMPMEILTIIFLLLPTHLRNHLLLVCRTWRDVLYNISRLWTFIEIAPRQSFPLLDCLEMASRRASRTGVLPLTVSWRLGLQDKDITKELSAAITELFTHAPICRWDHLVLYDASGFSDEIVKNEFAALSSLTISISTSNFDPHILNFINKTAKLIKELHVRMDWAIMESFVPNILSCINTLHIENFDQEVELRLPENVAELILENFPRHLSGIQNLACLAVDRLELPLATHGELSALTRLYVGSAPMRFFRGSVLRLPSLAKLFIPGNARHLLTNIESPKLRCLWLGEARNDLLVGGAEEPVTQEEIIGIFDYIFCHAMFPSSIDTLKIDYKFNADILSSIIYQAPKLQELDMTVKGLLEAIAVFQPLFPHPREENDAPSDTSESDISEDTEFDTCPSLAYLTIRYEGNPEGRIFLEDMRDELMQFRGPNRLMDLTIVWNDGADSEDSD